MTQRWEKGIAPMPTGDFGKPLRYSAQERKWVMRLLARLSKDQRERYEVAMRAETGHHHSGKKYDRLKARVAERILYEDSVGSSR